jgi:hypothetical protein
VTPYTYTPTNFVTFSENRGKSSAITRSENFRFVLFVLFFILFFSFFHLPILFVCQRLSALLMRLYKLSGNMSHRSIL